ncbi:MAG TPA: hypothetical protein VF359_05740 [Anaerolineales bacterium]
MTKSPRNFWVGLIYLLVGIFIVSGFSLYYLVPIRIWPLLSLQTILKPSSYMFISGGFIGVTGLMLILVPKTDKV